MKTRSDIYRHTHVKIYLPMHIHVDSYVIAKTEYAAPIICISLDMMQNNAILYTYTLLTEQIVTVQKK